MRLNLSASDEQIEKDVKSEEVKELITSSAFAALFLLIISLIGYGLYYYHARAERLDRLGSKATGELDNEYLQFKSKYGAIQSYQVQYTFAVNQNKYRGTSWLHQLPEVSEVVVLYDPDEPNNNRVEGGIGRTFFSEWGQNRTVWWLSGCPCLLILLRKGGRRTLENPSCRVNRHKQRT